MHVCIVRHHAHLSLGVVASVIGLCQIFQHNKKHNRLECYVLA